MAIEAEELPKISVSCYPSESEENALHVWQSYAQCRDNAHQSTPHNRQPPLESVSHGTMSATGQYAIPL